MKKNKFPFERISIHAIEENIEQNGTLTALIDVCGFFLCRKGRVKVLINDEVYIIDKGSIFIYTPNTFVRLIERSEEVEGLVVKSSLDVVLPFVEKSATTMDIIELSKKPCFTLDEKQLAKLEEMMHLLETRVWEYQDADEQALGLSILYQQIQSLTEAFFYELLYDCFCNHEVTPERQSGKEKIFQLFMLSLMRNYKKEREVAYYAQEQCLSPRYFSTLVKSVSGHTASEWIVETVISYASQLLRHTDKSIKEIALEFSFPTQSFFGKYFKQYTGHSPKEFRNMESE